MAKKNPGAGRNIEAPGGLVPDGNYATGNPRARHAAGAAKGGPGPHPAVVKQLTPRKPK